MIKYFDVAAKPRFIGINAPAGFPPTDTKGVSSFSIYLPSFQVFSTSTLKAMSSSSFPPASGLQHIDTDALDYFRWISYLLDAIKPSTDFLLYMIVSDKFRNTFFG